jgi:uncharacterized membrane protein YedE/YeeE
MKGNVVAGLAGALFGVGLSVSGMTRPDKVVGFLDLTGAWDASLMFVMGGAIAVHLALSRIVRRRPAPAFDARWHLPTRKDLDPKLFVGAALFGIGWGLGGYCPGPGLVSGGAGSTAAIVFVGGMTLGMLTEQVLARRAPPVPDRDSDPSAAAEG